MASLNKVFLIGNITKEPEIKYLPKGTAVAEFGIAVNESWKNDKGEKQEKVTFLDLTAFGKTAEIIGEYCRKGRPVHIEGKLAVDSWDDKQSGQKRYKTKIIVEGMQMLGGKREESNEAPPAQQKRQQSAPVKRETAKDPDLDMPPDDVPF